MFVLGVNERWEAGYLGAWIFTIFNRSVVKFQHGREQRKAIKSGPEASRWGNWFKQ